MGLIFLNLIGMVVPLWASGFVCRNMLGLGLSLLPLALLNFVILIGNMDKVFVPKETLIERAVMVEEVKYSTKGELVFSGNLRFVLTGERE